jgi:hypothetical protein
MLDDRPQPRRQEFSFNAQLFPAQERALDAIAEHELGVLEAPPGTGRTIVACGLIARTGLPTLILVDRAALLDQWQGQVGALLGVKPGQGQLGEAGSGGPQWSTSRACKRSPAERTSKSNLQAAPALQRAAARTPLRALGVHARSRPSEALSGWGAVTGQARARALRDID